MGYTSKFLTTTKGTGVINRIFHSFDKFEGKIDSRKNGAFNIDGKRKGCCFCNI